MNAADEVLKHSPLCGATSDGGIDGIFCLDMARSVLVSFFFTLPHAGKALIMAPPKRPRKDDLFFQ